MVQTQSQPGSRREPPRSAVSSSMTSCPGSIAFASSYSQNHPWPTPTFHFARKRKPFPLSSGERAGVRAIIHPLRTQPIKNIHGFGKEMSIFSLRIASVHGDQHNSVYTLKKVFLTWRAKNGAPKPAKTRQNPPKPAIDRGDPHFLKRRVTIASLRWGNPTIIGNRTGVVTFLKLAGKEKVTSW